MKNELPKHVGMQSRYIISGLMIPLYIASALLACPKEAVSKSSDLDNGWIDDHGTLKARHREKVALYSELQAKNVVGTVVSATDGQPIPGVTVRVKDTERGTVTDIDGHFTVEASQGETLVFSFVGFVAQEITVGQQVDLMVRLEEDLKSLDEVVVVGYGTQNKRAVTGTVESVNYKEFEDRSYSDVSQSLAGKMPGVNISQGQGAPGSSPIIRIRGINSITAGTTPLFVVDGMPMENFDLNLISPQDIASVEVLKDASAAAIYGSRGSNGVILITTKLGEPGKTNISFTQEYGIQEVKRRIDLMDAQQFIDYYIDAHNNAWVAAGGNASDPNSVRDKVYQIPIDFTENPEIFGTGTDWQDVMFRTAPMTNTELSVSGGNDKTQYLFSGGYRNQTAVLDENYYKRLTLRSNIRQQVSDRVSLGLNLTMAGIYDRTQGTEGKSDVISLGLQSDPIFPVYNENGNLGFKDPNSEWYRFTEYSDLQLWHPYSLTREISGQRKTFNTMANAFGEIEIIEGLKFRSSVNVNLTNGRSNSYRNEGQKYGYSSYLNSQGDENSMFSLNWLTENTLKYEMTSGLHSFNALVGYIAQKQRDEYMAVGAGNFPNDLVHTLNAGTVNSGTSTASEWSMLSYLARVNYDFNYRYFLTATLRRDGSSRFGSNTQWGYFPSVSAGWMMSEEDFMKPISWINTLKLRVSYGLTGNNQIPNYGTVSLLTPLNYTNSSQLLNGLKVANLSNPDLKWEKTQQFNIGLDLMALNGALNFSANYYNSTTNDLLLNVPIPDITGFSTQLNNVGSVRNRGLELSLGVNKDFGQFNWNANLNYSFNRNKVMKLGPDGSPIIYTSYVATVKTEIGQPISNFYGYIFDGVFTDQQEIDNYPHHPSTTPGDPKVRDVNGDGEITEDDRTIIGNYQPDFTFGFTNSFAFKGLELSFMLQGVYGGEMVNQLIRYNGIWNAGRNAFGDVANYWRSESDPGDGEHFKPTIQPQGLQEKFSTYWVEDASFLRIRNIKLSYTLPQRWIAKTPLQTARVYVNVDNAFLFSDYSNYDPENTTYTPTTYSGTSSSGASLPSGAMIGVDYGSYPVPRIITFGAKFNF